MISTTTVGTIHPLQKTFSDQLSFLSIHLTQDDVDAADGGHHVGHQPPLDHEGQGLQVDERRTPDLETVGFLAAVAYDVEAQFSFGSLNPDINLCSRRRLELAGDTGHEVPL